jgi:hypothetical protein
VEAKVVALTEALQKQQAASEKLVKDLAAKSQTISGLRSHIEDTSHQVKRLQSAATPPKSVPGLKGSRAGT